MSLLPPLTYIYTTTSFRNSLHCVALGLDACSPVNLIVAQCNCSLNVDLLKFHCSNYFLVEVSACACALRFSLNGCDFIPKTLSISLNIQNGYLFSGHPHAYNFIHIYACMYTVCENIATLSDWENEFGKPSSNSSRVLYVHFRTNVLKV